MKCAIKMADLPFNKRMKRRAKNWQGWWWFALSLSLSVWFCMIFSALFANQFVASIRHYCSSFSVSHNKYRFAVAASADSLPIRFRCALASDCCCCFLPPPPCTHTLIAHRHTLRQRRRRSAVLCCCCCRCFCWWCCYFGPRNILKPTLTLANFRTSIIWLGFQHYLCICFPLKIDSN